MEIKTQEISLPLLKEKEIKLFIKRTDQTHQHISGNKWYKLKYNLIEAKKQGSLKEIFGAGTAALVSLISHFGYKNKVYELPKVNDSYASSFKKQLMNLQYNKTQDPFGWRVEVK